MSYKIYCAYRAPICRTADALAFLHGQMRPAVLKIYHDLKRHIPLEKVKQKCLESHKGEPVTERDFRYQQHQLMEEALEAAMRDPRSTYFDTLSSQITVLSDQKYVYFIPFGIGRGNLWGGDPATRPADWPDWLEDYHHQTQTDPAYWINRRIHNKRGKKWDVLTSRENMKLRASTHYVFSTDRHRGIEVQDLRIEYEDRYHPDNPCIAWCKGWRKEPNFHDPLVFDGKKWLV